MLRFNKRDLTPDQEARLKEKFLDALTFNCGLGAVIFCFAPTSKKKHLFAHKYLHSNLFMLTFVYNKDKEI